MAAISAFLSRTRTTRVVHFTRNIHYSTPLSHHLPRDPNVPYNPRWKSNPIFPPGFFKKMFEDARAKFELDYLKYKVYSTKTGTAVGQLLGIWAVYMFKVSREIDWEKEKQFNAMIESFEQGIKEFENGVAVLKERKNGRSEEKKKKLMEEISMLENLNVVQRLKVAQRITTDELLLIFFQKASNEEKKLIIKAISNGEI